MPETPKITLEADYKKVDEKALTDAKVDSKKLAEKAVTKDKHMDDFKKNFEKISNAEKLTEYCTALQGTDKDAKKTAIDKINASLNESFTIVEKKVDGTDMIAFKMHKDDTEFTLIAKEDFHSLFSEMVTELYQDCGGMEVDKEIKENKEKNFELTDEVVIGGTKLEDMKTKSVDQTTNPAAPVNPGNPGNPGEKKGFFASISKTLKDWGGKIRDTLSKKAAEKKGAGGMLAGFWTGVDSFMNGESGKSVKAFLKDMGDVTGEIASVTDEVESTVAEVTDGNSPSPDQTVPPPAASVAK